MHADGRLGYMSRSRKGEEKRGGRKERERERERGREREREREQKGASAEEK